MGIGAIRKPTPDGYGKERWQEYNSLSPRMKRYFFGDSDAEYGLKWDEAEAMLQKHKGDNADIFEYLRDIDLKTPQTRTNERTKNYLKGQAEDGDWNEEDHNRDEKGRFAKKKSFGTKEKENNQNKNDGDKIEQLRNALDEMLLTGKEEITIKNVITDLEQYGGTNDITLKWEQITQKQTKVVE